MNTLTNLCLVLLFLLSSAKSNAQDKNAKLSDSLGFVKLKVEQQKAREEKMRIDWPSLTKYRDANIKLGIPLSSEKRVVFMGNSITEVWAKTSPDFFSSRSYISRGISGQTTPQMLLRFRADVINLRPKVVVILAGANDIAGNTGPSTLEMIEDNISSMVELSKAHNIKVILCSVLPAYDFPWSPGKNPVENIATLNEWIKIYCTKNNIVFVDYYSVMADERKGLKSEYTKDGVHPTLEGYKIMEPLIEEAIKKVLGMK